MRFENWISQNKIDEAAQHHKKHKHKYHCPGCGGLIYVARTHPLYGPFISNYIGDHPHNCPTTNNGQPAHDPTTGAVAATTAASTAASAASGGGADSGGGGGAAAAGGAGGGM